MRKRSYDIQWAHVFSRSSMSSSSPVDILILGAGWTATFLIPLCVEKNIKWAATTRGGSTDPYTTIPFNFDQDDESEEKLDKQCKQLPDAKTVLVTFPLTTKGAVGRLVQGYRKSRKDGRGGQELWVQLGTTSIWDNPVRLILPSCSSLSIQLAKCPQTHLDQLVRPPFDFQ